MKPIRNYSDGQWLLLLWAFIIVFLITGIAISKAVMVVAILGAIGALFTTLLYARERIGRSPTGSLFGRRGGTTVIDTVEPPTPDPPGDAAPRRTENREGGAQ